MDVILVVEVSQSISRFTHRFVKALEDNSQATKCMHKQFTVKSVGSERCKGVCGSRLKQLFLLG